MTDLLKPDLYRTEGTAADPAHPALLGGSCKCGYIFFPMQVYGCEKCGSAEISPRLLSGRGKLIAGCVYWFGRERASRKKNCWNSTLRKRVRL